MTPIDSPTRDLLESVARATRLREGAEGVAAVLRAVYRAESSSLQDVAREARLPLPVTTAIRRELEKAGLLDRRHGLSLSPDGRRYVEQVLGFAGRPTSTCGTCDGIGLIPPPAATARLAELLASAPPVDVTLDQAICTPDTALRRAALMYEAGAVEGRRLLILGDDDSISIAVCLLFKSVAGRLPDHPITVVELDPRRVAFLQAIARQEQFPIDVVEHDLREPLPSPLVRHFDVFETDPPYTSAGARLFLSRATEALDPGVTGMGFLSYAQRPAQEMLELQRLCYDLRLAITALRPGFNRYQGASVLGSAGQLFELVAMPGDPHDPLDAWRGPLYSAEVNPRTRRYRCKACGAVATLGEHGVPETIEALKTSGCPACAGRTFHRLSGQH